MSFTPTGLEPYFQSALNTQQPPSPAANAVNTAGAATGPTTALGQLQYNIGGYELGQLNTNLQAQTQYQNTMAGYQQGQLGIQAQQQGIQRTGLQQQGALNTTQQGIEQQQYNTQQTQYPEQYAQAALGYQNAMKNIQDSSAASGTATTQGTQRAKSTETQQYGWQQQDIGRNQALSQMAQQSEQAGFQYSQEQLANASANLDLMAKANGMSQDQVKTMLDYGIKQAGFSAQTDALGLLSGMATEGVSNLQQLEAQISSYSFAAGFNSTPQGKK